jgi:hypothetical protein
LAGSSNEEDMRKLKASAMTIKEKLQELEAREFFERLGYVVNRIPGAAECQSADYIIEDDADQFSAEVKSRGPDEESVDARHGPGDGHPRAGPLGG